MSNLRQRAAGQEVAPRPDNAPATLNDQIKAMEAQFQMAMPKGVEATQLVRDAMTAIRQTPKLMECDPQSVLGSLMTCAQLGLRVGVLGQAWVLPFYDNRSRGHKAQLIIGYQGLVELAHRSERIASLIARVVYERDEFDIAYGLEDRLEHKPFMDGDRGEVVGYYAIVKLIAGGHAFIFLTKREAEQHRDDHAMAKKRDGTIVGPWRDDFDAMALKTCVIKLAKWMPKSTDLARAIEADEGVRLDTNPDRKVEDGVVHHFRNEDTIEGEATETTEPPPDAAHGPDSGPVAPEGDEDGLGAVRADIYKVAEGLGLDAWATEEKFSAVAGVPIGKGNAEQLDGFLTHLTTEVANAAPADPKGDDQGKDQ